MLDSMYFNCALCGRLSDDGGHWLVEDENGKRFFKSFCLDCDEDKTRACAVYLLRRYKLVAPNGDKVRKQYEIYDSELK